MTAGNQAATTAEEWLLGVDRGRTQPLAPPAMEVKLTTALTRLSFRPGADVPEARQSQA